jgi:hypothetical protein
MVSCLEDGDVQRGEQLTFHVRGHSRYQKSGRVEYRVTSRKVLNANDVVYNYANGIGLYAKMVANQRATNYPWIRGTKVLDCANFFPKTFASNRKYQDEYGSYVVFDRLQMDAVVYPELFDSGGYGSEGICYSTRDGFPFQDVLLSQADDTNSDCGGIEHAEN